MSTKGPSEKTLRRAALVAIVAGAAGSIASTLYVGRRNSSFLLIATFVVWVLSPFAGLGRAHASSPRWAEAMRTMLLPVTLTVALGSTAIYGYVALGPPRPQPAFWFLVVPMGSWLLITVAAVASRMIKGDS